MNMSNGGPGGGSHEKKIPTRKKMELFVQGGYRDHRWGQSSFVCPHPQCSSKAQQVWSVLGIQTKLHEGRIDIEPFEELAASVCHACGKASVWKHGNLIYPLITEDIAPPNKDLPEEVVVDYLEALSIFNDSPRGAAALLRLCAQKICDHFNVQGNDLKEKINNLVQLKGLPDDIHDALHIVRLTGNDAVHAGVLDIQDQDREIALNLFGLINVIGHLTFTTPKQIGALKGKSGLGERVEKGKTP